MGDGCEWKGGELTVLTKSAVPADALRVAEGEAVPAGAEIGRKEGPGFTGVSAGEVLSCKTDDLVGRLEPGLKTAIGPWCEVEVLAEIFYGILDLVFKGIEVVDDPIEWEIEQVRFAMTDAPGCAVEVSPLVL